MNLEYYDNLVGNIENILCGTKGYIVPEEDLYEQSKEGRIRGYCDSRLVFEGEEEKDTRIQKAIEEIVKSQVDFATLENVLYAFLAMSYFAMREMEWKAEMKVDISEILGLCKSQEEKRYLETIAHIVFAEFTYACCVMDLDDTGEIDFEKAVEDLTCEALAVYPKGEIAHIFRVIKIVEEFYKNPTEELIEKLKTIYFDTKYVSIIPHILTCAKIREDECDKPQRHYIPHVVFEMGCPEPGITADIIKKNKPVDNHIGLPYEEKEEKWIIDSVKTSLKIPYQIEIGQTEGDILHSLLKLTLENKDISDSKSEMVHDFTHRYNNLAADNLYNIAQALLSPNQKNDEELKDVGRELLIEYDNKQMLAREVVMLNLEHTDRFEEMAEKLRKSVCHAEEGINIEELINEAAKRVLIRILVVADDNRVETIREKYEKIGIDTWELMEQYEEEIVRKGYNCVEWIKNNMTRIKVIIGEEWKNLRLKKNTEGSVFLMSLIMELLFNMFTYAEIKEDKIMEFSCMKENDEEYFLVETKNIVDLNMGCYTRKGLASRNKIISKLNYGNEYRLHDSILTYCDKSKNEFHTQVKMKSNIFFGRE